MRIGEKAVPFDLADAAGGTKKLEDVQGKAGTVIVFSCNHCPYVLAWEERILGIARRYMQSSIGFALINANDAVRYPSDSFEQMARRVADRNYPMPYLHDESQEVARAYGAERTPEVFVFNGEGRLVYRGAPDDSYDDESAVQKHYLRDALESVLAGKEPEPAETPAVGCTIKWK